MGGSLLNRSLRLAKKPVLEAQKGILHDLAIKAHFQHVFNTWCNLSPKKTY